MGGLSFDLRWRRGDFTLEAAATLDAPVTALLGDNGAGKTTLLRLLAGLLRPDAGHVRLGDAILSDHGSRRWTPPHRRGVGMVFQEPRLFPHLRVGRQVRYGGDWKADAILGICGLVPLLERRPAGLSGGEQRRVAIARALLARPRALLVDEPLASLDAAHRASLLTLFGSLHAELGVPIVLATHHVHEALALTSRALVLHGGQVAGHGDLFELMERPEAFGALAPLGVENRLRVVVTDAPGPDEVVHATLEGVPLVLPPGPVEAGQVAAVGIRPEDCLLATSPPVGLSARNALPGRVVSLRAVGAHVLVHIDVGQPLRAEVTAGACRDLGLAPDQPVHVVAKTWAFVWRTST